MARFFPPCALILALTLSGLSATATAQDGAASRYLKGQHDRVARILGRPANRQRSAEITRIIGALLDYEALSREALGDHWDAHSAEEQQEFVALLRQLVERSYQSNLDSTASYQLDWGDEVTRGGAIVVRTTARSRTNRRAPEVSIEYRMRQRGNRWVVVDVVTDGVSMVRNYRNQFERIISRDGWDALLERMRTRLSQQTM